MRSASAVTIFLVYLLMSGEGFAATIDYGRLLSCNRNFGEKGDLDPESFLLGLNRHETHSRQGAGWSQNVRLVHLDLGLGPVSSKKEYVEVAASINDLIAAHCPIPARNVAFAHEYGHLVFSLMLKRQLRHIRCSEGLPRRFRIRSYLSS
jgi:hypothetical protein